MCEELKGRMKDICSGASGLSAYQRRQYIDLWISQGLLLEDPDKVVMTEEEKQRLGEDVNAAREKVLQLEPNIIQKAMNFSKAIAKYVKSKERYVSKRVYEERLKKCETCIFQIEGVCKGCGCPLISKAKIKTEKCPEDKWDE